MRDEPGQHRDRPTADGADAGLRLGTAARFFRALAKRDRPVYVHYAVSSRCNLHCRSCSIWQRPPVPELPLPAIDELATYLKRAGCVQVSLGGGEPAMRDDLPEIVRIFLRRGIGTRVLTNGVAMTPDIAGELLEAGLREISFSLNSLDPDKQEWMDDAHGTFATRLDNLGALAEALPRRGALPLLNCVVSSANLDELPAIVDLANDIGFWVAFVPLHQPDGAHRHRFYGNASELELSETEDADIRAAFDRLIQLKHRGAPILSSTPFLKRAAEYLIRGEVDWPCRAGQLFLSVGPDGGIAPCHAFEGSWEVPAETLCSTLRSLEYRQELGDRLRSCEGCFRPCWAEVSFLMLDSRAFREMVGIQLARRLHRRRVDLGAVQRHTRRAREQGA